MSSSLTPATGVPVSADEIARRSYEQRYLIEDRIVLSLVEIMNQGIRDQVAHAFLHYDYDVPAFIYGFPKFHVDYVAAKLRMLYTSKGFHVTGEGRTIRVTWETVTHPPPPRPPPPPPPKKPQHQQHQKKKMLLSLPSS